MGLGENDGQTPVSTFPAAVGHSEYPQFAIQGIAKSLRIWQAGLMAKSKVTAREKSRQERERAKSLEDRSRQLMRKAAQLRQKPQHEDIRPSAAGIAEKAGNGK
jgi:hypothetical protein